MQNEEDLRREISIAYDNLKKNDLFVRTNTDEYTNSISVSIQNGHRFYLKDETKQECGSFKFRGLVNQIGNLVSKGTDLSTVRLLTFSAGNYGRAFAKMCAKLKIDGLVIMPEFAPQDRLQYIESQGIRTERQPTDKIQSAVERHMKEKGSVCFHPFDDIHLICGHASFGLEILEDVPNVDVVVVCCGGGGILAATALAVKLFGRSDCLVYGVEPENANTMNKSFVAGEPSWKNDAKSIASGLSPPYAGKITYELCRKYVDDILLVSEEEILQAMVKLHGMGIKAEPSGSAAMAAVMFNKIPVLNDDKASLNVLISITGGNCSDWDFKYVQEHAN